MNSPAVDAYLEALLDSGAGHEAVLEPVIEAVPAGPASAPARQHDSVATVAAVAAAAPTIAPLPAPALSAPRVAVAADPPMAPNRPAATSPVAVSPSRIASTHRWLRVAVGEDSYALELLRVQEVGRTVPIVAMRGAAAAVLGAMNLRGRIVPVFDLGLWLGTGRVHPDERARIVVVERDNELIGALVSAVDDVVTLGPDRIEPPLIGNQSGAIVGVARVVAKPTVLLDANALFG